MYMRLSNAVLALVLVTSGLAYAEDHDEQYRNLAKQLVDLRSQVEELANDLDNKRQRFRLDERDLVQKRSDLERQIKLKETELATIDHKIDEHRTEIDRKEKMRGGLRPLALRVSDNIERYVAAALPFDRQKRAHELDKLAGMVRRGEIQAELGLARLWSFVEDELRMTRENGLYSQRILFKGSIKDADVVKLGTAMMFFRIKDAELQERYGKVVGDGKGNWAYQLVDAEDEVLVKNLFDSMKKHIRTGYYVLPDAIGSRVNK